MTFRGEELTLTEMLQLLAAGVITETEIRKELDFSE